VTSATGSAHAEAAQSEQAQSEQAQSEQAQSEQAQGAPADSPRKRELLEAAYAYALANGLADLSLRPLAKAIGSSPRVLLFLFGSKDGLMRALLARARQDELAALTALRSRLEHATLADTGREVWAWLVAPSHRALLSLWLEGYARSLLGEPGPWERFAAETVDDWLDLLATCQPAHRRRTKSGESDRTLLLAVLRGALLDVLATGDSERVTRAVERYLDTLGA
jgi:AcrR family transcriptional regulator